MTKLDFILLCGEYLVDMDIALENTSIRQALLDDVEEEGIRLILEREF